MTRRISNGEKGESRSFDVPASREGQTSSNDTFADIIADMVSSEREYGEQES